MCLFALKRFDDAAAVDYAVLTAGPGWNWTTMAGLYPNVEYVHRPAPGGRSVREGQSQFDRAHFPAWISLHGSGASRGRGDAVRGRSPASAQRDAFRTVREGFEKAAEPVAVAIAAAPAAAQPEAAPAQAPAVATATPGGGAAAPPAGPQGDQAVTAEAAEQPAPPPPPAPDGRHLEGAARSGCGDYPHMQEDGEFAWEVDSKGQKQSLAGKAGLKDNELALFQQEGPPLIGKVTQTEPNKFVFAPTGSGDKAPGLTFTK